MRKRRKKQRNGVMQDTGSVGFMDRHMRFGLPLRYFLEWPTDKETWSSNTPHGILSGRLVKQ